MSSEEIYTPQNERVITCLKDLDRRRITPEQRIFLEEMMRQQGYLIEVTAKQRDCNDLYLFLRRMDKSERERKRKESHSSIRFDSYNPSQEAA